MDIFLFLENVIVNIVLNLCEIYVNSWRYYTSYDNGEWRRHATPMYKADAELDVGISSKLAERRSASMTAGLTTHDDIIEIEDGEDASSHSRQASALERRQKLRGTACLTRDLPPAAASSATDSGPTTVRFLVNASTKLTSFYAAKVTVSCNLQCRLLHKKTRNRRDVMHINTYHCMSVIGSDLHGHCNYCNVTHCAALKTV